MSDVILEMKNITKRFPGVIALDDVSFRVNKGEIRALVGENGAGKSTLMKILNGVYSADSGEIWMHGTVSHQSASRISPTETDTALQTDSHTLRCQG